MLPRHHKALWLDPQPIGDSVDIVEVRGDLHDVVDVAVVEAMPAQFGDLLGAHAPGRAGQVFGVFEHGAVGGADRRLAVVGGDLVGVRWVGDLGTEVVRMGLDSVRAAVGGRDDDSNHLTLGAA